MLQGLHNSISDINIVTKYDCTMFITNDLSCFTQDIDHLMTEDAMPRSIEFLTGNLFRKESSIGTSIQSSKRTTGGSEFNSRDRRIHLVAICVMRGAGRSLTPNGNGLTRRGQVLRALSTILRV